MLLSYKRAPIFVAPDLGTSRECRVDGGKQPIRCDCPRTETRTTADTTFPEGAIPPLLKFGGDDPLSHQVAFARLRGWLVSDSPSFILCLNSQVVVNLHLLALIRMHRLVRPRSRRSARASDLLTQHQFCASFIGLVLFSALLILGWYPKFGKPTISR